MFRDQPVVPLLDPARRADRRARARPARNRGPHLGRLRHPVRDAARHPGRLPDPGDADRRHRPVGRHGRVNGRGHRGDAVDRRKGPSSRSCLGLAAAAVAGIVNGVGIGVFRVHPLIMTLGTGLVVLGLMAVYQLSMNNAGTRVARRDRLARAGADLGGLSEQPDRVRSDRRADPVRAPATGFGRLLYAVGDNPMASRLAGARIWQVLVALYVDLGTPRCASPDWSSRASRIRPRSRSSRCRCCRPSPPRSSAAPRSSAVAAVTPERSSGRSS